MSEADASTASRWPRLDPIRVRAGQLVGLLFLVGPLSDLAAGSEPPARVAAIALVVATFAAVYLTLLPPVRWLARRGRGAIRGALAALAALAVLPLALGAPESFVLLLAYVVAAAGIVLPVRPAVAVTAVAGAGVAGGLALAGASASAAVAYALTVLAAGVVMIALGSTLRANRELRAAREELAELAVSEERLRIARDLHDLLGHTLSLIALKSDLATRLVAADPDRAREEMAEVQRVTRDALGEVREAVHGYRRLAVDDALDGARAALSAAGIDCRVERGLDTRGAGLSSDAEGALAWAVREAATNVVRHSGARSCTITLASDAETVSLQVDDDGAATRADGAGRAVPATARAGEGGAATADEGVAATTAAGGPRTLGGAGLAGLAERARRAGGTLEAGARPDGGFRLRLIVPTGSA